MHAKARNLFRFDRRRWSVSPGGIGAAENTFNDNFE